MKKKNRTFLALWLLSAMFWMAGACAKQKNDDPVSVKKEEDGIRLQGEAGRSVASQHARAEEREFLSILSLTGTVVLNPRLTVQVTPIVSGRVDTIFAFPNDRVRQGEPVAALHSPDFLAAQSEYLQLLYGWERIRQRGSVPEEKMAADLLGAAETKLQQMGMTTGEIHSLRQSRTLMPLLILRSPLNGTVYASDAVRGGFHEAFRPLMTLADFSSLWLEADVFEKDIGKLETGDHAEIRPTSFPNETFLGQLAAMGSAIDATTRTLKARIQVKDRSGRLRPGMFAAVEIRSQRKVKQLAVPEEAVRTLNQQSVVFVSRETGEYVPRPVKTGRVQNGWVEILSGLNPGEIVATAGAFLLKSEMLKKDFSGE